MRRVVVCGLAIGLFATCSCSGSDTEGPGEEPLTPEQFATNLGQMDVVADEKIQHYQVRLQRRSQRSQDPDVILGRVSAEPHQHHVHVGRAADAGSS